MSLQLGTLTAASHRAPQSYALAFGCLLLLLGRLADIFGRKPMFLIGCVCPGADIAVVRSSH